MDQNQAPRELMISMRSDIEVRLAYLEDLNFIFATWLKSYRHASSFARKISNDIFYKRHHLVIDLILKREGSRVLVAHPTGEPNVILGYVVSEKQPDGADVLHYVYVKKSFRQMGIGKALWGSLLEKPQVFTHFTADTDWIIRKYENLTYDPYRI